MLVLSRRLGESIRINDDIVVTVERLGGQKVRLGIAAPRDVVILRSEIDPRTRPTEPDARPETRPDKRAA